MGSDGNLWFTGTGAYGMTGDICMMTPTGVFTAIAQPAGNYQSLGGLTLGPNGNVWFTEKEDGTSEDEQPAVGEINAAGVTKLFAIPLSTTLDPNRGVDANPTAITTGPDGALWFTDNAGIGRITTDGTVTQFPLPTPGAIAANITSGPGGALWFTQQGATDANNNSARSIGEITSTGTITIYPIPTLTASGSGDFGGITEGPDDDLWFTENLPGPHGDTSKPAIGRITATGQIQTFDLPRKVERQYAASVGNIKVGPDGDLWFPVNYTNGIPGNVNYSTDTTAIGRITKKGKVTVYHVSSHKSYASYNLSTYIMSGADGKLWYASPATTGSEINERVARISTGGKLGPDIPIGTIDPNTVPMPNGDVWFEYWKKGLSSDQLGLATCSGVVLTQDVVAASSASTAPGYGLTLGPDGNLWATGGATSIVRISGLDTINLPAIRKHVR